MSPFVRMPQGYPVYPDDAGPGWFEEEPTDEELGWNDDIPVNCDGETEEEDDQWR